MGEKLHQLRRTISEYVPGNSFATGNDSLPKKLQIQLMGLVGHGKSSIINSCLCVWANEEFRDRVGTNCGAQSVTTRPDVYTVTEHISMVDSVGIIDLKRVSLTQFNIQTSGEQNPGEGTWGIRNFLPSWLRQTSSVRPESKDSVISIAVIVFKASCGIAPDSTKGLIEKLNKTLGIAPLVVITFADEYKGDIQQLKEEFATLHCPHVFIVTCYNKENKEDRDDALDKILLDFLVACTDVAEKRLRFMFGENSAGNMQNVHRHKGTPAFSVSSPNIAPQSTSAKSPSDMWAGASASQLRPPGNEDKERPMPVRQDSLDPNNPTLKILERISDQLERIEKALESEIEPGIGGTQTIR
eukprot:gi/632972172/ref/XP_007902529.1/ PREDICTED: uncharacterized protein LOC103185699 [Callorhinchus milii]